MEPKKMFWKTELLIPGTPWILSGYSRSAYRTGFFISGLDIMLDAGPQSFRKPGSIFITHTHADHIAELPLSLIQDIDTKNQDSKISIHCPMEAIKYIREYVIKFHEINSVTDYSAFGTQMEDYYNFIPIDGTTRSTKRFIANKQAMILDTIAADHSIPTVIYGFSLVKKKLNPLYHGLPGKDIAMLKKSGTEVNVEVTEKKFCYVLDTSIKVFEQNPFLFEYPVIITECTFLYEDEIEMANKKKHIHWNQLKPYVVQYPSVFFILVHFSQRYKDQEICTFFDDVKKTDGIMNIHPWLSD
jgi:ribonuclease Z